MIFIVIMITLILIALVRKKLFPKFQGIVKLGDVKISTI